MARRGRFGRSETGASDLSATIRSLVQQQAAQEEQVFMKAFYDGTEYNGKIPTMDEVIKFYERVASLSGIARGSEQWTFFEQKIGDANNFDIRRTYNALVTEFDDSEGANYVELMEFLDGRANTSTDVGDLASYQKAIGETTKAYVQYQGKNLVGGEITATEYRSIVGDLLEVIGKDDPKYYDTLVDAYTWEWTAEKQKWDDRLRAGTVTLGQYTAWANGFRKDLVAAGISKDSTLYTGTLAAVAVARGSGSGGTSPARTRYDKTVNELSSLWDTISQSLGFEQVDDAGAAFRSTEDVLEKIRLRPEFGAEYAAYIDDNPWAIPADLKAKGISDGTGFLEYLNGRIDDLKNNAESAYVVGALPRSSLDKTYSVTVVTGNATYFEELRITGSKWIDDRSNAKNNEQLLEFYDIEYEKYLNGQDSFYGTIPDTAKLHPETQTYLRNELAKINGQGDPNATGITNFGKSGADREAVNGVTSSVKPTAEAASAIRQGRGVMEWREDLGEWQFSNSIQGAGLQDGTYQYIRVEKKPDGSGYFSFTAIARGKKVVGADGVPLTVPIYRYQIPDGMGNTKILVIDAAGNEYDPNSISQAGDVWIVRDPKMSSPTILGSKAPKVDISATMPEYDRTIGILGRMRGESEGMPSPEELIKIQEASRTGLLALDPVTQVEAATEVESLALVADQERARRIALSPEGGTEEGKLEIIRLTAGEDSQEYRDQKWIVDNKANLIQTGPYDWRFKTDYQEPQNQGLDPLTSAMAGFAVGAPSGALVGAPIGPVGIGAGGLVGGLLGAAGGLVTSLASGAQANPQFEALAISERLKPDWYKQAQRQRVAASPQAQQYNQTGYPSGSNVFFRNINNVARPMSAPVQPSGYLGLQANIPMPRPPAIPPSPKPLPIVIGDPRLRSVAGDSLRERRESVIRASTPTQNIIPATSVRGGSR